MNQLAFDFSATAEPEPAEPSPDPALTEAAPPTSVHPPDADALEATADAPDPGALEPAADTPDPATLKAKATELASELQQGLRESVRLIVTDNKRLMISAKRKGGVLELRLHHMFLRANSDVRHALVRYLRRRDRKSGRVLDDFIAENESRIDRRRRRATVCRPKGRFYHLREIFEELRPLFPESMEGLQITWGKMPARRRQRSIQLGSYAPEDKVIRVHPVLDQEWVPRWYVAAVVYHEMLHHALPAVKVGRTLRHHTPEFRRREREFEWHDAAKAWEDTNFRRLLQSLR
ncbi:MAG: hypothetical protein AAGE52_32605 [Myxococcota bacterium]